MALDLVLGVAIVLGVLILVHEWGHFIVARLFGVRVDVFSIGFGPRLWSFRKGETEYGVRALPLGAFVRIIGMNNMDDVIAADLEARRMAREEVAKLTIAVAVAS